MRARLSRQALRVVKLRGRSKREHALVLADMLEEIGFWHSIPTGRRLPPVTFNVYSLDVWGNHHDGYEVNERYRSGKPIRLRPYEMMTNIRPYAREIAAAAQQRRPVASIAQSWLNPTAYVNTNELRKILRRDYVGVPFHIRPMGDDYEIVRSGSGKPLLHIEEDHG